MWHADPTKLPQNANRSQSVPKCAANHPRTVRWRNASWDVFVKRVTSCLIKAQRPVASPKNSARRPPPVRKKMAVNRKQNHSAILGLMPLFVSLCHWLDAHFPKLRVVLWIYLFWSPSTTFVSRQLGGTKMEAQEKLQVDILDPTTSCFSRAF